MSRRRKKAGEKARTMAGSRSGKDGSGKHTGRAGGREHIGGNDGSGKHTGRAGGGKHIGERDVIGEHRAGGETGK